MRVRVAGRRFSHVSCLAEQAKILSRRRRRTIWGKVACEVGSVVHVWCEQKYYGVVRALGWAC